MTDTSSASEYFASLIDEYDSLIRRAVPRYDEMLGLLLAYLPEGPARVLELGCGTGTLTLALLDSRPAWSITTVDASDEMIETTRARVMERGGGWGDRVNFVASRFEDLELEARAFDVVVSAISMHHVIDKLALFDSVHRALKFGGTFRFSDQLAGGTVPNGRVNWERWVTWCRQPGNCTEEELESLIEHSDVHDHYVSLSEHFRLLERAGFVDLDCVWRDGMWGVLTAEVQAP